jgi:phosphatidylglycerophosphate synthase
LEVRGVNANTLTGAGFVVGIGGAIAAGFAQWLPALVLWLASRVLDGLDGAVARAAARRTDAARNDHRGHAAGGFLDIMADFTVYAAFVVGVALGWGGSLLPFLAVLAAYYLNGAAFLAFSSAAERTGRTIEDGRSLSFIGGLAEGAETIAVHAAWCVFPGVAGPIAWAWAGVVGISAVQRTWDGWRRLR